MDKPGKGDILLFRETFEISGGRKMEYHWLKRVSGGILAGVMVLHCFPMPTFAAETDGLCPHHTQHTEACGYSAAVEWHECGHEHTDECYQSVMECVHVHGDCGYVPID